MSKSLGNYIGINESPKEIFGKTLSIPDELIYRYFLLCTDVPTEELDAIKEKVKENPLKQKRRLARELVKEYYDEDAAKKAQEEFDNVFRQGGVPDDIPVFELNGEKDYWICKLMVDLEFAKSNGQARRLIKQGAVSIDGEKVTNANLDLSPENEFILKVGKRRFAKVIP
jgi:tyrosyl-tRNA synthetase